MLLQLPPEPSAVGSMSRQGLVIQAIQIRPDSANSSSRILCNLVSLDHLPVSLTCGFYGGAFSADLTAEEEQLVDCTISVTVAASGLLIGALSSGLPHRYIDIHLICTDGY